VSGLRARTAPRRRRGLQVAATVVALVAVGIGAVFGTRLTADPALVDSPLIGQPAPDVVLPELVGTGELSVPALRGQVVVVNFWASWCVACREEHSALVNAARDYRSRGVTFVGIDYQDSTSSAEAFLDELGRGGDNYRYATDVGSRAALKFGLFGVPETFVLDRAGTVVSKITGGPATRYWPAFWMRSSPGDSPVRRPADPCSPHPGRRSSKETDRGRQISDSVVPAAPAGGRRRGRSPV
jgi:cytochrome c biogenesis protein CcmG/thiol:disulfide interchange protein DsbE